MTRGVSRALSPAIGSVRRRTDAGVRSRRWTRAQVLVAVAMGLVVSIWGSTYLAIAVAIDSMPPMLLMAVRFAIAGSLLFVVAVRRGDRAGDRITRQHVVHAAVTGCTLLVAGTGMLTLAQGSIPSGLAALIAATVPLFLALFARGAFGERLSGRAWLGLLIGLAGVGLLVDPQGGQVGGILLALVGAAAWAAGSLRSRVATAPKRPMVGAGMEMMAASVAFAIIGLARGEAAQVDLAAVTPQAWFAFGYLVLAGSIVAYTAYTWLLRNASTQFVGTHAYINPIVAVLLGWLVLGEAVSPRTLLAGAVVLVSVVLLITGRPGEPIPAQMTSGADVFAGSSRWHRMRRRVGSLPRAARLYRDPGVQQTRSVGYDATLAAGDRFAGPERSGPIERS